MAVSDDIRTGFDEDLLVRIAHRYYIENRSQREIAHELGFSRPKVQRLLERARETGIVEIRINGASAGAAALESRLRVAFGLTDAIVTEGEGDQDAQRQSVARAAAAYLEGHAQSEVVVAVGMGRNTGELADFYRPSQATGCTFVSAMGGSPSIAAPTNPNDICRVLAERAGGRCESLFAPAFVETRAVRDRLVRQEAVAHTLRIASDASVAVVGVGGTDDACTMVKSGCCPLTEMARLRAAGAVGDILGNYFDVEGQLMAPGLEGRIVGLTLPQLRRIPMVIVMASERSDKIEALLGALRTGVPDVLIVDEDNARHVLEMNGSADTGDQTRSVRRTNKLAGV